MGCATGMVKFIMFLFNFIFVVGGILMVTAGSLVLVGYKDYQHVVNLDSYKAPPILLIVVGAAIFFIAFMGCCGALRESSHMMMTYALLLAIILLVQAGIAVGTAVYEKDFKEILHKGFKSSIKNYDRSETKQTWDATQSNLNCCGSEKYTDWTAHNTSSVPDSCCRKREDGCGEKVLTIGDAAADQKIYTNGCVEKVLADLKIQYVIITAAAIAGIELLGIMFSCCLAARFHRKNYA